MKQGENERIGKGGQSSSVFCPFLGLLETSRHLSLYPVPLNAFLFEPAWSAARALLWRICDMIRRIVTSIFCSFFLGHYTLYLMLYSRIKGC
jgi:hypothetical protein